MKENVAVINQINEEGSQTGSAAETRSHRQVKDRKLAFTWHIYPFVL